MARARPVRALLCCLSLVLAGPAEAQVPPHQPGTLCLTPQFWCWTARPLYPGSRCYCPSPYGPVWGYAG